MPKRFLIALCASLMLSAAAQASDFSILKDNIKKYRALKNTPEAPQVEFTNAAGDTVTLADFKGKTILLNLWATWCPPCIKEMPELNELAREFKDQDFIVLAIATGRQGRETPDDFLKNRDLNDIQSYLDPKQKFLTALDINTLPVSFFIAPDGTMQGGIIGITKWTTPEAKAALTELLKK